MPSFSFDIAPVLLALTHVVLGVVVLVAAKLLKQYLTPYRTDEELTARDNPAYGLALAGYYAGVVIIFLAAARAEAVPVDFGSAAALRALGLDLAWALGGVVALAFSRWLMDRALVPGCCASDQIVAHRNTAAGVVECSIYIASALVLAGALREPGGTIWTTVVFFLLSQGVLLAFGRLYQRWAGYDVAREIAGANLAAGTALGLTLVAISLLMLKATSGDFIDWPTNLGFFAFDAVAGFALLMLLRWITDAALLPNARIGEEIVRDRNVNVGLVEGVLATGIAALILYLF